MDVKFLYSTVPGRRVLKWIMDSGVMDVWADFLHSSASRVLIKPYIRHNDIDMFDFQDQKFQSFADFFARKRNWIRCEGTKDDLISPCDSRLSVFLIRKDSEFCVKGSRYRIDDLVDDPETAAKFEGGLCLIYRLESSDYHHFCYIDDAYHGEEHRIPGVLHSVQPIACAKEPVFRLNRRVWSLMETENFGPVAQIEVGALLVGGIVHERQDCQVKRGDEMGHFELAGSTIIQLFTRDTRKSLKLRPRYREALRGKKEMQVKQGQVIGAVKKTI